MRLLSYTAHGAPSFGVLTPDRTGVVDLAARIDGVADLGDLIAKGRVSEAAQWAASDAADHALGDIVFDRLLPRPGKIFCIGVNYGGRGAEYAEDRGDAYPSVFVRFPDHPRRPRAAPAAAPRVRAARLRGRDRGGDRHRRAPHLHG